MPETIADYFSTWSGEKPSLAAPSDEKNAEPQAHERNGTFRITATSPQYVNSNASSIIYESTSPKKQFIVGQETDLFSNTTEASPQSNSKTHPEWFSTTHEDRQLFSFPTVSNAYRNYYSSKQDDVLNEEYQRRFFYAQILSIVGIILTFCQGIIAVSLGLSWSIVSVTAMGAQPLIDLVSSILVYWRFRGAAVRHPSKMDRMTRLAEAYKERRSLIGVGVVLIIVGLWVVVWSLLKLTGIVAEASIWHQWKQITMTMWIAWPSVLVFGAIAVLKISVSRKLHSTVVAKDAMCTVFGVAMALITGICAAIDYSNWTETAAHASGNGDSVAGLFISLIVMVEGTRTIVKNWSD
eukprot:GHVP01052016.1.p1 GENE.GHVP01052016.1~~GHVP01052016.1.p1  ORF type:complete len:352 (+),score=54.29 GHVP01052016.1:19-1074(+)